MVTNQIQLDIAEKLAGKQRLRAEALARLFSTEELSFISTFPGDTLKEQALRAVGNGTCKRCGGQAPYRGKVNFLTYCSLKCQVDERKQVRTTERAEKLQSAKAELAKHNIVLENEQDYQNVASRVRMTCVSCGMSLRTQLVHHALRHVCRFKKPRIKKLLKPEKLSRVKQKNQKAEGPKCIDCGATRNPKAKPGRCMPCHTMFKRKEASRQHLELLRELGFTTEDDFPWDSHSKVQVTNVACGHSFSSRLGNILTGAVKCGVCGPSKRHEKRMAGYLSRYARQYDLRDFLDYSTAVRRLSDKNWEQNFGRIEGRGHAGIHLDHRVPIIFGFNNKIAPEILADVMNIQPLHYRDNLRKGGRQVDWEVLEALKAKYGGIEWAVPVIGNATTPPRINLSSFDLKAGNVLELPGSTLFIARNERLSFGDLPLSEHEKSMIVFEDELSDHRRRIVESMLNHSIGSSNKIQARKCEIREVDQNTSRRFMNTHHLSGAIAASIRLGLFYQGVLQCLLLCSKSRFDKNYDYELIRFANRLDTTVIGGLSKLFTEFKRRLQPASVMTYADRRFGRGGEVYSQIGMKLERVTPPSTWWVKNGIRVNTQDIRPNRISKLLGEDYNPNLPADLNMERAGWTRIDDLGSNVYSWRSPM